MEYLTGVYWLVGGYAGIIGFICLIVWIENRFFKGHL
jgi:hypothetical protein